MPVPGALPTTDSNMDPQFNVSQVGNDTFLHAAGWVCDNSVASQEQVPCQVVVELDGQQQGATAGTIISDTIVR